MANLTGTVALAGETLAITGDNKMVVLDRRTGKAIGTFINLLFTPLGPPLADSLGNFYAPSNELISLDNRGRERWRVPLWQGLRPEGREPPPARLLISPDDIVYSAQGDGRILAFTTKKFGRVLWSKTLSGSPSAAYNIAAVAGFGDHIVVNGYSDRGFEIRDRRTGDLVGNPGVDGSATVDAIVAGVGIIGHGTERRTASESINFLRIWDIRGRLSWVLTHPGGRGVRALLTDNLGRLALFDFTEPRDSPSRPDRVHLLACGTSTPDSVDLARPAKSHFEETMVLGADGTVYALTESDGAVEGLQLIAFDQDFKKKWRLDFPDMLQGGRTSLTEFRTPALSDDGVLYFALKNARSSPGDVEGSLNYTSEVFAVQTASPGLTRTARRSSLQDNRRSGWALP